MQPPDKGDQPCWWMIVCPGRCMATPRDLARAFRRRGRRMVYTTYAEALAMSLAGDTQKGKASNVEGD